MKELIKDIQKFVNEFPYLIDVCYLCAHRNMKKDECKACCFFYGSKFEIEEKKEE